MTLEVVLNMVLNYSFSNIGGFIDDTVTDQDYIPNSSKFSPNSDVQLQVKNITPIKAIRMESIKSKASQKQWEATYWAQV
jgi:hypothetical protein